MKDIAVGILLGLVMLVILIACLWFVVSSNEASQDECQAKADRYGNQATCIVVVR